MLKNALSVMLFAMLLVPIPALADTGDLDVDSDGDTDKAQQCEIFCALADGCQTSCVPSDCQSWCMSRTMEMECTVEDCAGFNHCVCEASDDGGGCGATGNTLNVLLPLGLLGFGLLALALSARRRS